MDILLIAGSPSFPSQSTRLLHHVGERLANGIDQLCANLHAQRSVSTAEFAAFPAAVPFSQVRCSV